MQARMTVVSIEDYLDKDDHAMFRYVLRNKSMKLSVTFDSRTKHEEFSYKREFEVRIKSAVKATRDTIKCKKAGQYLRENSSEDENRHRYKFVNKTKGIIITFDGQYSNDEFVLGKQYDFTIEETKHKQTSLNDHVDQEAAGAKS